MRIRSMGLQSSWMTPGPMFSAGGLGKEKPVARCFLSLPGRKFIPRYTEKMFCLSGANSLFAL